MNKILIGTIVAEVVVNTGCMIGLACKAHKLNKQLNHAQGVNALDKLTIKDKEAYIKKLEEELKQLKSKKRGS